MAQIYTSGLAALEALNRKSDDGGKFASFKSGTAYRVRVLGTADLMVFRSYGIFNEINSFVADKPSVYNAKGYPVSDLTVWDKASEYYSKLAFEAEGDKARQDELRQEARKYRGKERFAMGFVNLETGEPIILDLSKKQTAAVHAAILKNESKLHKKAFEIEKTGTGQATAVLFSPLDLDDLTAAELANFEKHEGAEFNHTLFENILYEADEAEQVELLVKAGFDPKLIGLEAAAATQDAPTDEF